MSGAGTDAMITIGTDVHGAVLELDASRWSHGVLTEALRQQLVNVERPVSVWVDHPGRSDDEAQPSAESTYPGVEERLTKRLKEIGLKFQRDLYRMERSLPLDKRSGIQTRAFVPGVDNDAWIALNNRAFRAHREQGGWTREMLAQRMAEPWFDPEGFRIHEIDGEMAAFCWTKIHSDEVPAVGDEVPAVGEVYAIAVDPDFHGTGLGRALTLAGYQHLAGVGITRAMLYVDADNTPAVTLYRDIGLEVTVVRRLFTD